MSKKESSTLQGGCAMKRQHSRLSAAVIAEQIAIDHLENVVSYDNTVEAISMHNRFGELVDAVVADEGARGVNSLALKPHVVEALLGEIEAAGVIAQHVKVCDHEGDASSSRERAAYLIGIAIGRRIGA